MRWWRRTGRHRVVTRCLDGPGRLWESSAPPSAPPGCCPVHQALAAGRSLRTGSHPEAQARLNTCSVERGGDSWPLCMLYNILDNQCWCSVGVEQWNRSLSHNSWLYQVECKEVSGKIMLFLCGTEHNESKRHSKSFPANFALCSVIAHYILRNMFI